MIHGDEPRFHAGLDGQVIAFYYMYRLQLYSTRINNRVHFRIYVFKMQITTHDTSSHPLPKHTRWFYMHFAYPSVWWLRYLV